MGPNKQLSNNVVALFQGGEGGGRDQKNCEGIVVIRETAMVSIFCKLHSIRN